jgi:rhamnulokinase
MLAFDLGAESGRCMVGSFNGKTLSLREVYRFKNGPIRVNERLHWDILRLFSEVKDGLAKAVQDFGEIKAFGLDTWGVDFALLDASGELLGNPFHYRDSQTEGMLEEAFLRVPREEIYRRTGIQFMRLNTLYQLLALKIRKSPMLPLAETFLTIPDLFNYWLTGLKLCEYTNASSTQCLSAETGDWDMALLEMMDIPTHIFPEIIQPGTVINDLLPYIAEEVNITNLPIIAVATHDNASAVASVPTAKDCYLCSGTWSVVGSEINNPIINQKTLHFNFTNEGGVCGTTSIFKNVVGLWIIQECRRTWASEGKSLTYDEICVLAAEAPPFTAVIDPDAVEFLNPGNMPQRIRNYCRRTNQQVPEDIGCIARTVFESLALKYRWCFERLEEILGHQINSIQIVGGGSQNKLLNQFVANAIKRPVIAGPSEATTIGNILMQMLALGYISSLSEGREIIRHSFQTQSYYPEETAQWDHTFPLLLERLGSVLLG